MSPENRQCGIVSRLDAVGLMDIKCSHRAILREAQENETEEKSREQSSRMLSSFNWSHWKRRDKEGLGKWPQLGSLGFSKNYTKVHLSTRGTAAITPSYLICLKSVKKRKQTNKCVAFIG